MKISQVLMFCGALVATACADDSEEFPARRGTVDVDALKGGWTLTLQGSAGSVTVPFSDPVPDVTDTELQGEMAAAVSLTVRNPTSGTSVDLASGTLVTGGPSQPGEYSWTLNGARDEATLQFYNETAASQSMHAGTTYEATLTIVANDYVNSVSATAFDVTAN